MLTAGRNQQWAWKVAESSQDSEEGVTAFSPQGLLEDYNLERFDFAKIDIEGPVLSTYACLVTNSHPGQHCAVKVGLLVGTGARPRSWLTDAGCRSFAGSEFDIFQAKAQPDWLHATDVVAMEIHHWMGDTFSIVSLLRYKYNFHSSRHGEYHLFSKPGLLRHRVHD